MNRYFFVVPVLLMMLILPARVNAENISGNGQEMERISLLTCNPGNMLHTLFGHSAIRVKDSTKDIVFNYGTFDFDTPHFYAKFVSGLLPYKLSAQYFESFYKSYRAMNTDVYEQVLKLDSLQTRQLIAALLENYRPENRTYLYNFLYDNCSTRIRDVFEKNIYTDYAALKWKSSGSNKSYWQMLDEYLADAPWSQWGIHTILGDGGNKKTNLRKEMFLPRYLMNAMDSAYIGDVKLVSSTKKIISSTRRPSAGTPWYFLPWTVFAAASLVLVFLSAVLSSPRNFIRTVAFFLYILTGLIGLVITYLAFTKHPITFPNWNILWAFPLNLPLAFLLFSHKTVQWVKIYLNVYMGLLIAQIPIIFFSHAAIPYSTIVLVVLMFYFSYRVASIRW